MSFCISLLHDLFINSISLNTQMLWGSLGKPCLNVLAEMWAQEGSSDVFRPSDVSHLRHRLRNYWLVLQKSVRLEILSAKLQDIKSAVPGSYTLVVLHSDLRIQAVNWLKKLKVYYNGLGLTWVNMWEHHAAPQHRPRLSPCRNLVTQSYKANRIHNYTSHSDETI